MNSQVDTCSFTLTRIQPFPIVEGIQSEVILRQTAKVEISFGALGPLLPPDHRALLTNDGYDLDTMTLRHVLTHTSGMNEHAGDPRYGDTIIADPQHSWTRDEQVRLCVQWTDPVAAPGQAVRGLLEYIRFPRTVPGCILNHHAANGRVLAELLVDRVAAALR